MPAGLPPYAAVGPGSRVLDRSWPRGVNVEYVHVRVTYYLYNKLGCFVLTSGTYIHLYVIYMIRIVSRLLFVYMYQDQDNKYC